MTTPEDFDEWLAVFLRIADEAGAGDLEAAAGRDELERRFEAGETPEEALEELHFS